jgi:hypothetical protein
MLKKIFLIKSILSRYQKHPRELLRTRGSGCARCNRATILKKKLLGKDRKI